MESSRRSGSSPPGASIPPGRRIGSSSSSRARRKTERHGGARSPRRSTRRSSSGPGWTSITTARPRTGSWPSATASSTPSASSSPTTGSPISSGRCCGPGSAWSAPPAHMRARTRCGRGRCADSDPGMSRSRIRICERTRFALERELLLSLDWPTGLGKLEAVALEGGTRSLTRQVRDRGLETLVVGRDGVGYGPERWYESATFQQWRAGEPAHRRQPHSSLPGRREVDPAWTRLARLGTEEAAR